LLSKVEEEYANAYFFRVHKSFIINVSNLNTIIKHGALNVEMKTGDIIPVAKRRAHEFITYIQSNNHR
jgi:two-component system LytT family response regulator